ncbi:MAG: hypothetical protein RL536_494 [Candidatus Parcubacteria bacterium]
MLVVVAGSVYYFSYYSGSDKSVDNNSSAKAIEKDVYVHFVMDAYDKISENYWMKVGDYKAHNAMELPELLRLSLKKASNSDQVSEAHDRDGALQMITAALDKATSTEQKKQLSIQTVLVLTYNLLPVGRNNLLSAQQEVALRREVSNIDTGKDLYKDLGVQKGADTKQIDTAFKEKAATLSQATSTQAKAELQKITYAKKVLTNESTKALYDEVKIEPTGFSHIFGKTLYLNIKKISPTTLQEFVRAVDEASTTKSLNSLIIDFRGNIGGDLAFANALPGLFIGDRQYAYDLFSKEDYRPQRTYLKKYKDLERFKDVVILVDNRTQSTAELTAAILKRLNIARVVGTATAGWGTIENTYPLDVSVDPAQKYSLFLVNNITLGDDNQPIEGRGVIPNVDISKADWKSELAKYFDSPAFISVIQARLAEKPLLY